MTDEFKAEFEEFWTETASKVRAYMFCASGSWTDTDDLMQECYLKSLRGWGQFDGKASRQAWLFGIAKRTCADWFRKKKRKCITFIQENTDHLGINSEKQYIEQTENIWKAIKRLDDKQREVIHLRFAADLSYLEIAKALEIPVGTVRSRLHRALKALKKQFEE